MLFTTQTIDGICSSGIWNSVPLTLTLATMWPLSL